MAIDPSIALGIKPVQIENPLAQYAQVAQLQHAQNQNRLADLVYSEKQRELAGENALASLLSAGGKDADVIQGLASQGYGRQALGYQKQLLEQRKANAEIGHLDAQSGKLKSETAGLDYDLNDKKRTKAIVDIAALKNPVQAHASLDAHVAAGDLPPEMAEMVRQTIPQNPAEFPAWQISMLQRIMSPKDAAAYTAPDANTVANNKTSILTTKMTNDTSRANNAATVAATIRGQDQPVYDSDRGVLVDKKTGAAKSAVDATGQPLGTKPDAAMKKELMSINQQKSIIQGALDAIDKTPSAFSFGRGLTGKMPFGETAAGRMETPEQTQARAYVFNNVSRVINERAGAAQSAQELARLNTFLPADTDGPEQIKNKLQGFQTYLADLEAGTLGKPRQAGGRPSLDQIFK